MSLFLKQDDTRSRLQEQIAAELQEKARKRAEEAERPDGVSDSAFIEGTVPGGKRGWIWIVVIAVILAAIIFLVIQGASK